MSWVKHTDVKVEQWLSLHRRVPCYSSVSGSNNLRHAVTDEFKVIPRPPGVELRAYKLVL
eukprot:5253387-Amphidinium_carterae.1